MILEPRTSAPSHATGTVEFVPLEAIAGDATFRLREVGDVAPLASSIGRLGQLVPVELRPMPGVDPDVRRFQVVAGHRRIAALALLARDRVLARIHPALGDEDAWGIALTQALLGEPLLSNELAALRERLAEERVAPWAVELLDEGLAASAEERAEADMEKGTDAESSERATEPAAGEEEAIEITPDELGEEVARRLFEVNEDLAIAFESWAEMSTASRRLVVEQARYVAELYPFLTGSRR